MNNKNNNNRYRRHALRGFMLKSLCFLTAIKACALSLSATENTSSTQDLQMENTLPAPLQGIRNIAFFGDSLTDGSSHPDYIVNTLNTTYPQCEFKLINAGVNGDSTYDLVNRLDRDVLSQDPDLTIILVGTNDSNQNTKIQYEAELRYLIQRLRAHDSKVMFMSLTGCTDPEKAMKLKAYDTILRRVAHDNDVPLVDLWDIFMEGGEELYHAPGDAHHSAKGWDVLTRETLAMLGVPRSVELNTNISVPENLLSNWEESGPIDRPIITNDKGKERKVLPTPDLVSEWHPYRPEEWIGDRHWSIAPLVERGAWFSLQADAKNRVAFARTTFDAPSSGLYELQVGGGTPLRVWVNGELVYTLLKTNGYHPNANRSPVLLKKGINEVIVSTGFYAFVGIEAL